MPLGISLQRKKVIYTSPIKALSNQKYHEFTAKYPDISFGILTGDIKFNPEADVLIMTTEILRNQIFHSAFNKHETQTSLSFEMDIDNELGCVVFDEVHYINDKERGKIWEETILHLPKSVQMVMLSATIDKAEKFAEWVETREDDKCVYLASTFHRVVPLYHHGYVTLHESYTNKIKDAKLRSSFTSSCGSPKLLVKDGKFDEGEFYRIQQINTYVKKQNIHIKRSFVLNSLVLHLQKNNLLPGIVFIFSRAQVEKAAAEINFSLFDQDSKIPSIIEHECEMIIRRLPNHKEYLELPEFRGITKLLQKGIAFHHAGMLPVFREMIELLFAKNYIKLLVATETFAVGINMPTRQLSLHLSKNLTDPRRVRCIHMSIHKWLDEQEEGALTPKVMSSIVITCSTIFLRRSIRTSYVALHKRFYQNSTYRILLSLILLRTTILSLIS